MSEKIQFRAYLPPILTALKIHGTDGARLQLDVSDTDLDEVLKLRNYRETILKVTIEPEQSTSSDVEYAGNLE